MASDRRSIPCELLRAGSLVLVTLLLLSRQGDVDVALDPETDIEIEVEFDR